jgi:hypothetical protein
MYSSPFRHATREQAPFGVRLACFSHAASVQSEPGSNSSVEFVAPGHKDQVGIKWSLPGWTGDCSPAGRDESERFVGSRSAFLLLCLEHPCPCRTTRHANHKEVPRLAAVTANLWDPAAESTVKSTRRRHILAAIPTVHLSRFRSLAETAIPGTSIDARVTSGGGVYGPADACQGVKSTFCDPQSDRRQESRPPRPPRSRRLRVNAAAGRPRGSSFQW